MELRTHIKFLTACVTCIMVMILCNLHLFHGASPTALVFDTERVAAGEWWRIITHPFVHVSWYHLLLDGSAVFILWKQMRPAPLGDRLIAAILSGGFSLAAAILLSPELKQYGFCGFSGMAHGLALFLGLTWLFQTYSSKEKTRDWLATGAGTLLVALIATKSIVELLSGTVVFSNYHLGDLGVPIVQSHFGGLLGGLATFLLLLTKRRGFNIFALHRNVHEILGLEKQQPKGTIRKRGGHEFLPW